MGSNIGNIDLLKKLLPGLSPAVSAGLYALILDPSISISPYFYLFLVGGFATFMSSLGLSVAKKLGWKTCLSNMVGIIIAGYVVVSWARYQSIFVSVMSETVILVLIVIASLIRWKKIVGYHKGRQKIAGYYKGYLPIVFLCGLIIAGLFPVATIIQNIGEPPVLVVSPSQAFVTLSEPAYWSNPQYSLNQNLNVSIAGVYANSWDIRLTTNSSSLFLVSFLDNKENGPVEIPFLERGRNTYSTLRIEISPLVQKGTYNIILNFVYHDALGKTYQGSSDISVTVESMETSKAYSLPLYLVLVFIMIILAITAIELLIIRLRYKREKQNLRHNSIA